MQPNRPLPLAGTGDLVAFGSGNRLFLNHTFKSSSEFSYTAISGIRN